MKDNSSYLQYDKETLAKIVEAAKSNESDALSKLGRYLYEKIYPYIFYRIKNLPDAEDLTGEVILKILKALKKQKGNFLAWIYRIAANTIVDFHRRRAVRKEISIEEFPEEIPAPALSSTTDAITSQKLKRAMSHLTKEQVDVITLKFIQDYSNEEVAEILGKSVGAVKLLQFRALKILREFLKVKK